MSEQLQNLLIGSSPMQGGENTFPPPPPFPGQEDTANANNTIQYKHQPSSTDKEIPGYSWEH